MPQPSDAERRVDNLIALTQQLTGLLDSETTLLETRRPSDIKSLNDEKAKISALYQREMAALKSNPRQIKELSPAKRDMLKQVTADFRGRTNQHLHLLKSFRHVSEGIVKSVADEVTAKDVPAAGYGRQALAPKPAGGAPRAFAVNQVI